MSKHAMRRPGRAWVVPLLLGVLIALASCTSSSEDPRSKKLDTDPPTLSTGPPLVPTSETPTSRAPSKSPSASTPSSHGEPPLLTSAAPPTLIPSSHTPTQSPTHKPTKSPSGPVILSGGPTLDNAYPDFNIHVIQPNKLAHCFAYFNTSGSPVTVVRVGVVSRPSGGLVYDVANTDPFCDGMAQASGSNTAPVCGGLSLPPVSHAQDGGCVVRLNVPEPGSNANRVAEIRLTLAMNCVSRASAPCDRLKVTPAPSNPVRVQWTTPPFFVVACGDDPDVVAHLDDAARGVCPPDGPLASP